MPSGPTPPPYQEPRHYPPQPVEYERPNDMLWGVPKIGVYIVGGILLVVAVVLILKNISTHSAIQVQEQVNNAEQNDQLQQQQAQLEAQQAAIAEQQRLEQERLAREAEAAKQAKIDLLSKKLDAAMHSYAQAKSNLKSIESFHIGRTQSAKNKQMVAATTAVVHWESEITNIKNELNTLGVEFAPAAQ